MEKTFEVLAQSTHHAILLLSDTEVGKVRISKWVWTDTKGNVVNAPFGDLPSVDEQIRLMSFANSINGLVVKFVRKDDYNGKEMLVMERLYPISAESLTQDENEKFMSDFETKLLNLHESLFIHGDIRRPRWQAPECFDNIILTATGFRLIDLDFSIILNKDNIREFVQKKLDELRELKSFRNYFLKL